MKRVAPIDDDAIEDSFLASDLFIEGCAAIDVANFRLVRTVLFFFYASEVLGSPRDIDYLETGAAMSIEGGAAMIALE